MQLDDEMMVMTLRPEPEHNPPCAGAAERHRAAVRTGLILASIAAVFFVGIIVKIGLFGA